MEKDDWWRTLECAGNSAQDKTAVDNVMLRYRPIAPKPAVIGDPRVGDDRLSGFASKRRKRKYVRVSKKKDDNSNGRSSRNNGSRSMDLNGVTKIVTLQLLPEHAGDLDLKEESPPSSLGNQERTITAFSTLIDLNRSADPMAEIDRRVVEALMSVESVTASACGTYTGVSDVEIMDGLDKDTCPCYVSDGWNRVVWINDPYKKMVAGEDNPTDRDEFAIRLVKGETTAFSKRFTCRVKLQYTWRESKITKTVPCDAMKMEFGGFAWRLDTEAALSLGLRL